MGHYAEQYEAQERLERGSLQARVGAVANALANTLSLMRALPSSRELSLAVTNAEQAAMWLDRVRGRR